MNLEDKGFNLKPQQRPNVFFKRKDNQKGLKFDDAKVYEHMHNRYKRISIKEKQREMQAKYTPHISKKRK